MAVQMPKFAHSNACNTLRGELEAALTAWRQKWPNHCSVCHGAGAHHWYENHGPGLQEPMSEPCETCTMLGNCPRCGKHGLTDESDPKWKRCFTRVRQWFAMKPSWRKPFWKVVFAEDTTGAGPCLNCGWNYDDCEPAGWEGLCECQYLHDLAIEDHYHQHYTPDDL